MEKHKLLVIISTILIGTIVVIALIGVTYHNNNVKMNDYINESIENSKNEMQNEERQFYKEREEINGTIAYWRGSLYCSDNKIPIEIDDIKTKFSDKNSDFCNQNVILAYNDANKVNVVYSKDFGETWDNATIDIDYDVYSIDSPDDETGYLLLKSKTDTDKTYIYKSTDSYKTWEKISEQNMKIDGNVAFDQGDIGYVSNSNNEYYATEDGGKTFSKIITELEAAQIAEKEAVKEKYQYTSQKSDFKGIYDSEGNVNIASELIKYLNYDFHAYYMDKDWQTDKYKGQLMWEIRLFDKNQSLTSLYMYIDAKNGDILGAGRSSD